MTDATNLTHTTELPESEKKRRIMIRRGSKAETPTLAKDLWELTKPEITLLVAMSGMAGFFLASKESIDWLLMLHTMIGICLTSGAGGILNHYIERGYDATMKRTARRPLPAKRLGEKTVLFYGIGLGILGSVYLYYFVNLLTALLAVTTILLYVVLYTPLKRITKYNTLIGTIPGAMPTLGGWTAVANTIEPNAFILFAILVFWQMPHFLSLAWMYRIDYEKGGFKMLPVVEPDGKSTANQTLGYTVLLVITSALPTVVGLTTRFYLVGITVIGIIFILATTQFYEDRSHKNARKVLLASVLYIPLLLSLVLIDRFF